MQGHQLKRMTRFSAAVAGLIAAAVPAAGDEAWRTSPFHGAIDGATGLPIPCRCRHGEREYKLADRVCMQTPADGFRLVRCDLLDNVTTWIPTADACTISSVERRTKWR